MTYKKDKYRVEDALIPFILEGVLICHGEQYPRHSRIVGRYCAMVAPDYCVEVEHNKSALRRLVNLYRKVINKGHLVDKDVIKVYMIVTYLASFLHDNELVELRANTQRAVKRISRMIRMACRVRKGYDLKDKSAAKQAGKIYNLLQAEGVFLMKKPEPETKAKECPKCGGAFVLLRSLYLKKCTQCGAEYEWKLKKDQKPLL